MNQQTKKSLNYQGFTLIEVVLVLAIGGLIFLLAFIAFQQVSVNRRDTQRRADAGRVLAEIQNYYTDNGRFPDNVTKATSEVNYDNIEPNSAKNFYKQYMGGTSFKSPKGEIYAITTGDGTGVAGHTDAVRYHIGYKCDSSAPLGATGYPIGISPEPGAVAVQITLEKGLTCRDSR